MRTVDWTKWSAIAEIISAAAILITLLYLSVQTRQLALQTAQNTRAVLASMNQESSDAETEWLYKLLDTPESLINQSPLDALGDSYDKEDVKKTQILVHAITRNRENQWMQYRNGVLEQDRWEPYRDTFAALLVSNEVAGAAWDAQRQSFVPGFREEVQQKVDELRALRRSR
jgi:hypothetical protein